MPNLPPIISTLISFLLSWRTLFFLLAITNLKSLPFSWHIRLFRNLHRYGRTVKQNRAYVQRCIASDRAQNREQTNSKGVHPLFRPVTLYTHAPLAEIDYNLHKSNSTYFSDLDHSRNKLVATLIAPALGKNALAPYGIKKGLLYPILGSVHTSFLREIKPYENYEVRSRVLGWDRKWIVIASYFVRRATRAEVAKDRDSGRNLLKGIGPKTEEVVFACVLNKYVVKCGRMTVPPELCFAGCGWFDVRDEVVASVKAATASRGSSSRGVSSANKGPLANVSGMDGGGSATDSGVGTGNVTPALGPEPVVADAADTVQRVAIEAGRRLSMSAEKNAEIKELMTSRSQAEAEVEGWSWEEIDAERSRGLRFAERWLGMDGELKKQYDDDMARHLV